MQLLSLNSTLQHARFSQLQTKLNNLLKLNELFKLGY